MDFVLVWMSVLDVWFFALLAPGEGGNMQVFSVLRIMRILRAVRTVRLLKVFRELWLIVKGIIDSVRTVFWASLLLILVLYVASILAVKIIGKNTTMENWITDPE